METGMLKLAGMKDAQCAEVIAQTLNAINGVNDVNVSFSSNRASVTFDETLTSLPLLKQAVQQAGYEIAKPKHGEDGECCGGCGGS
ncbi:heavy-metal-associated domain-containing protein [Pusillimonas sp. ANT_WB101]|nr:heavy-metal-associated domain-containing protein [Pusillimonas sp. ANT_WB101]